MRTIMRATIAAAFLAALALATGCEDTPLFAGKDYKMTLVADPGPDDEDGAETWNIYATVVSDTNVAQNGITVFFSTTGGQLRSSGQGVTTHSDGRAADILTVQEDDPASITVTATSAALTKTVTVTHTVSGVCESNTAPTAVIEPPGTQTFPAGVVNTTRNTTLLDGTSSFDLESEIQSYSWTCDDGSTPIQTPTATCTYTYQATARSYTIRLVVTDEGLNGHSECALPSVAATLQVDVPAGTAAP